MIQKFLRSSVLHWPFTRGRARLTGILTKLLLARPETVAGIGRIRFPFLPDHPHYYFGLFEPETFAFFRSVLAAGDVCFDVGANSGYFTAIAADCVGSSGVVHAFEPESGHFARLQRLAELNPDYHIRPVQAAVAEKCGTARFFVCEHDGWHSLLPDFPKATVVDSPEVVTWSLDEFLIAQKLDRPGAVRLAKIDVEGAELMAIRGAARALAGGWIQDCYIETSVQPGTVELFERMQSAGYTGSRYDWKLRTWVPVNRPDELWDMCNLWWRKEPCKSEG
jgi:FkbM family methyltransferase